jgi:hypothetical protein
MVMRQEMRLADLAGAKEGQGAARSIGKQTGMVRSGIWAPIAPGIRENFSISTNCGDFQMTGKPQKCTFSASCAEIVRQSRRDAHVRHRAGGMEAGGEAGFAVAEHQNITSRRR